MIDQATFRFRPSARFFTRIKNTDGSNSNVSAKYVQQLFDNLSRKKEGNYRHIEIKKNVQVGSENIYYSICVFVKKMAPSFLISSSKKLDEVHAYIFIAEFKDHIAVSSSNAVVSPRHLKTIAKEVEHSIVSRCMVKDNSAIEKLDTESMDGADDAIRTRSVSARNLRNSWAPTIAGRQVIGNMRVKHENRVYTINPSTGRLYESSNQKTFQEFINWLWEIIFHIKSFKKELGYLDNFAQSLSFSELNSNRIPTSVLIAGWKLIEPFSEEQMIESCIWNNGDKEEILSIVKLADIFDRVYRLIPIKDDSVGNNYLLRHADDSDDVSSEDSDNVYVRIRRDIKLRKNTNSFSLYSNILSKIELKLSDGNSMSVGHFINSSKAFQITFNDPTVVYWSGRPFRDPEIAGRLEGFISIFRGVAELSEIEDEKSESKLNVTSEKFLKGSLFDFIENYPEIGKDADYLICDDLGDEWADYISIKDKKYIKFIHAKHKKLGLSATSFQEVISQATKNLGNMSNLPELNRKQNNWNKFYSKTRIKRLRKGSNLINSIDAYKRTIGRADSYKEVWLVIDFISKRELNDAMKRFVNKTSSDYQLHQLFWLITAFVSGCLDNSAKPVILCQE